MAFSKQITDWIKKSENRASAVLKESAQRLFSEAQIVGPSVANPSGGEGGKMPVDTGFLRASFTVGIGTVPLGPSTGSANQSYSWSGDAMTLQLTGAEIGDTIYGGWTAEYARFMEMRYGFMRSAAQNWQQIVDGVAKEAKARFG